MRTNVEHVSKYSRVHVLGPIKRLREARRVSLNYYQLFSLYMDLRRVLENLSGESEENG